MGEVQVRKLDDGTHALVGGDGRIVETVNPETNQRSVGAGFDNAAEAKKAAEEGGHSVKSAPSRSSSKSSSSGGGGGSSRKAGARRN